MFLVCHCMTLYVILIKGKLLQFVERLLSFSRPVKYIQDSAKY